MPRVKKVVATIENSDSEQVDFIQKKTNEIFIEIIHRKLDNLDLGLEEKELVCDSLTKFFCNKD